jgi:hypothetical protein
MSHDQSGIGLAQGRSFAGALVRVHLRDVALVTPEGLLYQTLAMTAGALVALTFLLAS